MQCADYFNNYTRLFFEVEAHKPLIDRHIYCTGDSHIQVAFYSVYFRGGFIGSNAEFVPLDEIAQQWTRSAPQEKSEDEEDEKEVDVNAATAKTFKHMRRFLKEKEQGPAKKKTIVRSART